MREERDDVRAEHRAAKEQFKAEAADRILVSQMRNRLGLVDKQIEAEAAIHEGRRYKGEPSSSFSLFSDSDQQGSSPSPPPGVAQGASGSGTGLVTTVFVLSDDE